MAIQCFLRQTHRNKELLIIADGEDVRDLVPENEHSIRLVAIEEGHTVGEKRNFGADLAMGQIIAHFDDDDYSAPGRLTDQIGRMEKSGKAVTGYSNMLFTDGQHWWRYRGVGNYAVGTSFCYRKDWWQQHKFPAKQVGEDGDFMKMANSERQLIAVDAGELMVASVHAGNTSPRRLSGGQWTELKDFTGVPGFRVP